MSDTEQLDMALTLALRLPPGDRLRLVERVVASVEQDIATNTLTGQLPREEHWGESLIRLIDALDLSDWQAMDIDDPVEWVNSLRHRDEARLDMFWEGSQ